MLPLIQREMTKRHWASDQEIVDYYAIGQMTPGIIAVNVSTFIGYKIKGLPGALCTLVGIILPSLIIISAIAFGLSSLWQHPIVKHAFNGIRLMVPALIIPIVFQMIKKSTVDKFCWGIVALAATLCFIIPAYPIVILTSCGLVGMLWFIRKHHAAH